MALGLITLVVVAGSFALTIGGVLANAAFKRAQAQTVWQFVPATLAAPAIVFVAERHLQVVSISAQLAPFKSNPRANPDALNSARTILEGALARTNYPTARAGVSADGSTSSAGIRM